MMQGHIDGKQGSGLSRSMRKTNVGGALDIDIYDLDHNELQRRIQKLGYRCCMQVEVRRCTFVFIFERVRTGKGCTRISARDGSCSGAQWV